MQRLLLVTIALACAGAGVLLVGWARQPEMALLYSDLAPADAAEIVEKARDAGIPCKLSDGGSTIHVPRQNVYDLRLTLASEGLPSGHQAGYKILDEDRIGTSPFAQRVNYVRAVEGEIARTIRLIDGVEAARVHVVRPEATLFGGREQKASATVALRLQAGWHLKRGNVAAIVHMVAGSVEGLSPDQVVVVDSQGTLLSGDNEPGAVAGASSVQDYKARVEEYLSGKAEQMLTAVLGPGRATVKVSAKIETSSVSRSTETYNPDQKVIARESINSTSSKTPSETDAATGETKEENIETEYLVGKTVEQTTVLAGEIESLTVAAFVDLSPPDPSGDEEGDAPAPQPVMSVEDAEEVIRNALGLGENDTLKVVNTTFNRPVPVIAEAGGGLDKEFWFEIARRGSLGVLVIGALLALRIFRGAKSKAQPGATEAPALQGQTAGQGNLLAASSEMRPEMLRAQITAALQENPEEVKRLFLRWAQSEKGES